MPSIANIQLKSQNKGKNKYMYIHNYKCCENKYSEIENTVSF